MSKLDDEIAALKAEVAADVTVMGSAGKLIDGFGAQLAAATAAALAAGATDAQLQSLTDLQTTLAAEKDDLAAKVAANTPAGP